MGPKSTRVPQQKCTSRCACTAAAAPWTPSFLYAFAGRLPTVLIEMPAPALVSSGRGVVVSLTSLLDI